MVRDGDLGRIRFAAVEHASGWAAAPVELGEHRQARWRTDPGVAGFPSVVGDLGTHAFHLLRYITGLEATRVSAELDTLVPGRRVFDNATVRLTLSNGAPATLWASMAATGNEHGLRIRVFGDTASIEWRHEDPQHLTVRDLDGGTTILAQGMRTLSEDADRLTRPGLGHPEGFLEAFANFYRDLADELRARRDDTPTTLRDLSFPTGRDGLIGVQFVEATAASHAADSAWVVPAFAPRQGRYLTCSVSPSSEPDSSAECTAPTSPRTPMSTWPSSSTSTSLARRTSPSGTAAVRHRSRGSLRPHGNRRRLHRVVHRHPRRAPSHLGDGGDPGPVRETDRPRSRARRRHRALRRARSLPAMVDFNRRFDRDYAELQRVVTSGEIGSVELIQMTSRGPAMPPLEYVAVSGGQMRDQTVHFFDLARWISGLDPSPSSRPVPRSPNPASPSTATSTRRQSPCVCPAARSSRSTAPGGSATATTNASRCSVRPAWSRRDGSAPDPSPGTAPARDRRRLARGMVRTGQSQLPHRARPLRRRAGNGAAIGPTLAEALKAQAIAEAATRSLTSGASRTHRLRLTTRKTAARKQIGLRDARRGPPEPAAHRRLCPQ